ncbi:Sugar transferase involved in LPS biosynthesis (colanic, teichoic acid) [Algoriphagus ornithinivorans]|uniref:Sugar transferase involved in LPS biosynthesis (Colanic, teichoic acid) n=1 Tax=Algoriphagus ornithinivorans TaxID=226506 RepID=A0A1I5BQL9_9BACT|nr:sugar transferase [Algoriphagus ornithinivorans]SFN76968.1 Sugar transferase involved in LPS biosynthesis (colanic, teichoic acid) [Algoriphagus ornithinivorans]
MNYRKVGKRLLDLLVAGTLFLLLSPLFLFLYLALFFYFRGNPIFKQTRPGFQTIPFSILKFKTMTDKKDSSGNLLPDSERITKFGRVIRKFSLDEMPQLLNVIRGDMSLVGPRPLLMEYLPLYNEEQIKRHLVKPGVSGWAQVNGRNTISWEEKFEFDTWYVENVSFLLDCKILLITFFNVLLGKGVSQQGHVSMGRFEGNKQEKVHLSQ